VPAERRISLQSRFFRIAVPGTFQLNGDHCLVRRGAPPHRRRHRDGGRGRRHGAAYSVEVRLANGAQVDVNLDEHFNVTDEERDDDGAADNDGGNDD
jgi:hypothetical protein